MTSIALYESPNCKLSVDRPLPGVVVITLSGWDVGEFGEAPLAELEKALAAASGIELFIDAREARGASVEVSHGWAQWLKAHRSTFKAVRMLTGSRFIQLSADFVRRYAELNDVMTVYRSAEEFDAALRNATQE